MLGMIASEVRLLNAAALARFLGTSTKWIKQEADAGRLPHVKADRQYLFDREAVESVLLKRAAEGGPRD